MAELKISTGGGRKVTEWIDSAELRQRFEQWWEDEGCMELEDGVETAIGPGEWLMINELMREHLWLAWQKGADVARGR